MMKHIFTLFLFIVAFTLATAQQVEYKMVSDIPYYPEDIRQQDAYISERCVLDVYYPADSKDFATLVWFHGGGLTGGGKSIPEGLRDKGLAVIAVNYRFSPKVTAPAYIEDAAAAVAWTFKNIENYGGDSSKIVVSGASAGGYLALMVGLDKQYLAAHGIDANEILGLIPLTGHTITHFTIRKEKGIPAERAVVDEYAPLFHVRADAPPLLLMTGDRELEMLGRYEENAYLERMMKIAGHQQTRLFEIQGYGHNMLYPAYPLMVKEIERLVKSQ